MAVIMRISLTMVICSSLYLRPVQSQTFPETNFKAMQDLFKVNTTCPQDYQLMGSDMCFKLQRDPVTWDDAIKFCDRKYLMNLRKKSFYALLSRFISRSELVGPSNIIPIWTSMRNSNNRLVWDDIYLDSALPSQPTDDNIYDALDDRPNPWSLSPKSLFNEILPQKTCGAMRYVTVTPQRRRKRQIQSYNIELLSCDTKVPAICLRTPAQLSPSQVTGCDTSEYSNELTPYCFVTQQACLNCPACPNGYSLFNLTDPINYLNTIQLSHMTKKYNLMLGIFLNKTGLYYVADNTTFKWRRFPNNHLLRQYLIKSLGVNVPLTFHRCLTQTRYSYNFTACGASNYSNICVRSKTGLEPKLFLTMKGQRQGEPEAHLTKEVKSEDIVKTLHSLTCNSHNAVGPTILLRNGVRVSLTRDNKLQKPMFAEGCYQCADWDMKDTRVYSNTICLRRSDVLDFVFEVSSDFKKLGNNYFQRVDVVTLNYLRGLQNNVIKAHHIIRDRIKALNIVGVRAVTRYIRYIHLIHEIDQPQTKYRVIISIQMQINQLKSANIYEKYSKLLLAELKLKIAKDPSRPGIPIDPLIPILPELYDPALYNTDFCLARNLTRDNQRVLLNSAKIHRYSKANICSSSGRVIAQALCGGDRLTGARLKNITWNVCLSFQQELDKLINLSVTPGNIQHVITLAHQLIRHKEILTSDEIVSFTDILVRVADVGHMNVKTGREFCGVYSTLMDADYEAINRANKEQQVIKSLVTAMETFTETLNLEGKKNATFSFPNLDVQLVDLEKGDKLVSGMESTRRKLRASDSHDEDDDDDDDDDRHDRSDYNLTFVLAPPADLSGIEMAIYLPKKAIEDQLKASSAKLRLSFVVQYKAGIFPNTSSNETTPGARKSTPYLNTGVVSMTVNSSINKYLSKGNDSVKHIFNPRNSSYNTTGIQCVFWNTTLDRWSGEGCKYTRTEDERVVCECSHLTNFAVLMRPEYQLHQQAGQFTEEHEQPLKIISIVGLILSIIGLSLTVLTFIVFPKIRKGRQEKVWSQKVLFFLALTLLATNIVFLAGIERTETKGGCLFVAALLHYLLIASFLWMLTEAVLQYLLLVKVLGIDIEHFILKACAVCWSVPLIPVIIVLAVDYEYYLARKQEGYCWLDINMSYWVFLIPVAAILMVNFGVFVAVLKNIMRRPLGSGKLTDADRKAVDIKRAKTAFYIGIACTLLLGLTWVFGYLSLIRGTVVFAYIFTIFNTLHGLFIFIFFTLRNPEVRTYWQELFCRGEHARPKYIVTASTDKTQRTKPTESTDSKMNTKESETVSSDSSEIDVKTQADQMAFMNNTFDKDSKVD